jgi:hypothetical protein
MLGFPHQHVSLEECISALLAWLGEIDSKELKAGIHSPRKSDRFRSHHEIMRI